MVLISACSASITDVAGDTGTSEADSHKVFAADCGADAATVLIDGECVTADDDTVVFALDMASRPQAVLPDVHPALVAAGHPEHTARADVAAEIDTMPATVATYMQWAKRVVLAPVLKLEEAKLRTKQAALADASSGPLQLELATALANVGVRHASVDQSLQTLVQVAGKDARKLHACAGVFANFGFAKHGSIAHAYEVAQHREVLACLDSYQQTLAVLAEQNQQAVNDVGLARVDENRLFDQVNVVMMARARLRSGSGMTPAQLQRVRELPAAVIVLWEMITEPLVLAQNLYPLARHRVNLQEEMPFIPEHRGPDGVRQSYAIRTTLASLAADVVAIHAQAGARTHVRDPVLEHRVALYEPTMVQRISGWSNAQRQAWYVEVRSEFRDIFRRAVAQALESHLASNRRAQVMLEESSPDAHWLVALAVESMGVMPYYGGYDGLGQPLGLQRIHDQLLAEAWARRDASATQWASIGSSAMCVGLSLLAGFVGTPFVSVVAFGTCAFASGLAAYEAIVFSQFARAVSQLSIIGEEYALFPPQTAVELSTKANIALALAAVDILGVAVDAVAVVRALRGSPSIAIGVRSRLRQLGSPLVLQAPPAKGSLNDVLAWFDSVLVRELPVTGVDDVRRVLRQGRFLPYHSRAHTEGVATNTRRFLQALADRGLVAQADVELGYIAGVFHDVHQDVVQVANDWTLNVARSTNGASEMASAELAARWMRAHDYDEVAIERVKRAIVEGTWVQFEPDQFLWPHRWTNATDFFPVLPDGRRDMLSFALSLGDFYAHGSGDVAHIFEQTFNLFIEQHPSVWLYLRDGRAVDDLTVLSWVRRELGRQDDIFLSRWDFAWNAWRTIGDSAWQQGLQQSVAQVFPGFARRDEVLAALRQWTDRIQTTTDWRAILTELGLTLPPG